MVLEGLATAGKVVAEVAEKAAEVAVDIVEKTAEVGEKVGEVATEAGGKIVDVTERTGEKLSNAVEKTKESVETKVKETQPEIVEVKSPGDGVKSKLDDIKHSTSEQLRENMNQNLEKNESESETDENTDSEGEDSSENAKDGLTDEQKVKIKEETGWSDEIIDAMGSWDEYQIYKHAGLQEAEIGGKKCLIRDDIDWEQKDAMGRTNRERAEQGLSPINKDGKVIELHHIGQRFDSSLAELTQEEHRGKGNDTILHDKTKESEIDRQAFAGERSNHWAARAAES